ncbi:MAG: Tm-1-like ATP-binding domain-containing protein [Chloroflexi bacterium]|nr:Tm-1-like ATP-binding domain-containing protein [Chloroflexota bacterium]
MQILVIGMLDEREEGLALLKEKIQARRHEAVIADVSIGTGALAPALAADITPAEIAAAGGSSIETVRGMLAKERDKAISTMAEGMAKRAVELYAAGELQGVIAVAGMTGTFLSLTVMRALPFGLPKVLISSVAAMPAYAGKFADYFGVRDITVMHTVTDTVGMNSLVRTLMINGAGAICGMVESYEPLARSDKPLVAMTEFGFCDKGAGYVRAEIKDNYNVVSFHATGLGDRAVEDLVGQGLFDAFVDLVPANYGEYLLGGNRASAPDRLEAACRLGVPYILSPCGFDMLSCGPIERKDKNDPLWASRKLAERKLFVQDAMRVQARTSAEEMAMVATAVAAKLNKHTKPKQVKFVIPSKGFSSLSVEGGQLHAPEIDKVFADTLRECLSPEIEIITVDAHINTPEFGKAVADALTRIASRNG